MKEKQNGKGKLGQHSHKKETKDYKCEQQRNPCVKNADLRSAIILKLS